MESSTAEFLLRQDACELLPTFKTKYAAFWAAEAVCVHFLLVVSGRQCHNPNADFFFYTLQAPNKEPLKQVAGKKPTD
jgi:hypothetical protein